MLAVDTQILCQTETTQYKEQLFNMTLNNKNTGPTFGNFASIRTSVNFEYTQCNTGLENVEKETAIAVTINSKLYFEQHMNKKTNKANSIMGLIRRILTCLDEEILLLLNIALVRLEYVNTIWNSYKIKDIAAIQNV